MSPYIVNEGREVYRKPKPYKCGDFVPGAKGELEDMEADGAVRWVDSPPREPKPKASAVSAAAARLSEERENNEEASEAGRLLQAAKRRPAKRKAVK